ncbi:2-hydroxyacid dehydrogenase [Bartonella sp. DGB2]|uniref:2-hydroxyacid dehydrogenase n=1 Tax=Bartonella sp. DGB2 TaxID=3388426 RepID=UPI00398FE96A
MHKKRPKVFITCKLPALIEQRMNELFDMHPIYHPTPLKRDKLINALQNADVLVPTLTDCLDRNLLAHAGPNLKLIANFGNGVDHIDLAYTSQRGILVTNTPNVLTEDTADMACALILALPRRLMAGTQLLTSSSQWGGWSPTSMLGTRLRGKTLGILGLGRIGIAVARRVKSFGLNIHYHNRQPISPQIAKELNATYWERLDDMLPYIDILSIHCPATNETHGLLDKGRIARLPKNAYVVNTARSGIINESALAASIETGHLAGAALDVFEYQPCINPALLALAKKGKVLLLPHMGSATLESRIEMGERVIINIRAFFDHHRPPDRILP